MSTRGDGRRGDGLTPLPAAGIAELLKATADLLCGPSFPSNVVNIVRDEAISVWEPAKRSS